MITFTIDEITPCLKLVETGEIFETEVVRIKRKSFLSKFNKKSGWYVNWSQFSNNVEIYALVLKGTMDIQGLVGIEDDPDAQAVHIVWACTAPHNNKWEYGKQKYSGVGGHLFAIAGRISVNKGYDGFVYGEAMDKEIMDHYINNFDAEYFPFGFPPHPYRIIVSEHIMKSIMEEYEYEYCNEEI